MKRELGDPIPRPPAQVASYVSVLGVDDTLRFLHAFGGTEVFIAKEPTYRSQIVRLLGQDKADALAAIQHKLQPRVPMVKPWRAKVLSWQGLSVVDIARALQITDVSVRNHLKNNLPQSPEADRPDPDQLSLFPET